MAKSIDTKLLLAKYYDSKGVKQAVSIAKYQDLVSNKDKEAISDFIFNRLHSRYLKPFFFPRVSLMNNIKMGFPLWQTAVC